MSIIKKIITKATAILLCACMLCSCANKTEPDSTKSDEVRQGASGSVNGLYVQTARGGFPSAPELSTKELKAELDEIVDFAALYGFNNIFFDAVSRGGAFYRSSVYSQSEKISEKSPFFLFDMFRFDPLKYLAEQADKKGVAVTAVVEPFLATDSETPPDIAENRLAKKNYEYAMAAAGSMHLNPSEPDVQKRVLKATTELAEKYKLSGIMLKSFAYPSAGFDLQKTDEEKTQALTALLGDIKTEAKKKNPNIEVGFECGFSFDETQGGGFTGEPAIFSKRGLVDFIVPKIEAESIADYEAELFKWKQIGTKVYTANSADIDALSAAGEAAEKEDGDAQDGEDDTVSSVNQNAFTPLYLQLYTNDINGADGCVIKNYTDIKDNAYGSAAGIAASMNLPDPVSNLDYEHIEEAMFIPQEFNITRPEKAIRTSYASYYLTGTSNPALPVTIDGEAVEQAPHGAFGTYVTLDMGENSFELEQDGDVRDVTITRYDPNSLPASPITEMRQSTIFPEWEEAARVGDELTLYCVAPSGAEVSAELEGKTVALKQPAANDGVPATFSARVSLTGSYPADETTRLGKITYRMSYNGKVTEYTSNGELSVIGKDADFAVEVTDMRGDTSSVDTLSGFRDNMITSVEKGARDYVTDESGDYWKLSCGGYIHKEDAKIIGGRAEESVEASFGQNGAEISYTTDDKGVDINIPCDGFPYYISEYAEDTVKIKFFNTSADIEKLTPFTDESGLLSAVLWKYNSDENSTEVTLKTGGKPIWGYNVEFDKNNVIIRVKRAPKISDNPARPLENVTIILDAGHGAEDPGALGVAGLTGPTEKLLNYANACAAYQRLAAMGADVHMTQTKDERLSYEQRMDIARDIRADFYISFHHNSTVESSDSTNAKGIEIYYNEELAIPFGESMLEELGNSTGRKKRGVLAATFRVTQMTHTPSLLCELGYVVSPEEYESLCDPLNIYKAALGTANAIVKTIEAANK